MLGPACISGRMAKTCMAISHRSAGKDLMMQNPIIPLLTGRAQSIQFLIVIWLEISEPSDNALEASSLHAMF